MAGVIADTLGGLDPTGILSASTAAVRLVGSVARTAPAVKNAYDKLGRSSTAPVDGLGNVAKAVPGEPIVSLAEQRADPLKEQRAYETMNYILQRFGTRLGEAGLVSIPALGKALTSAANTNIQVQLFGTEHNALFKSLASKLSDTVLVNSVFASIYFIGALSSELKASLPQYKDTYPAIGPRIIQCLVHSAIGPDAYKDNQIALLGKEMTDIE
jgi:hypothetical protein